MLNSQFNRAFSGGKTFTDSELVKSAPCQMTGAICLDSRRRKPVQPETNQSCRTRRHPTPSPERACQRSCPNLDQDRPVITADRRGAERLEREALVKLVFKKGQHYNPANHRPISLTSIPCKLLKHILVSSIMQHLESNSILSPQQHGFRKNRSCKTQLLKFST